MAKRKNTKTRNLPVRVGSNTPADSPRLLDDLRALIQEARQGVAQAVNAALVLLYWRIGKRIREDILGEKRAGYGEQIVYALSTQLTMEFGSGFSRFNLSRMIKFAEYFANERIVATLSQQLSCGWIKAAFASRST